MERWGEAWRETGASTEGLDSGLGIQTHIKMYEMLQLCIDSDQNKELP